MPNFDNLIDTIQQNLNTNASPETAYFSTLDLKYAYSQLKLHQESSSISILTLLAVRVQVYIALLPDFMG